MVDTRFHDPKLRLRFKTAVKSAIAVILTSLLLFISGDYEVIPNIAIVLGSCYITITMHASVVGTIRNSTESLKGGFLGFIIAYILAMISSNSWYHVACIFLVSVIFAIHDPFLTRGIFTKLAVIDAFIILYTPSYFTPLVKAVPVYFVISHCVSFVVAILCSLLIWPQLSSRQFMVEFRYCMELCRELFLVLSLKLDNEVIIHEQDQEAGDSAGLLQQQNATEKHIRHLEHQYSKKLIRLGRLLKESKWETWNTERNSEYDKMLEVLERLLRQLVSTHEAIALGKFSRGLNSNFVSPMFPLLETLQASILSHLDKLVFPTIEGTPISPHSVFPQRVPVASSSAPLNPEDISHQMEEKYTEMVRNYEAENKSANPSGEITRMVFTIFGAVEFSQWLHQLEESIARLSPDEGSVRMAVCKDILKDICSFTPMATIKWAVQNISTFKKSVASLFKMKFKNIYTSPSVHFPVRFSLGVLILTVILNSIPTHLTDRIPHYNPSWPPVTFLIAILPSLGATIRKCFHRITGTVVGAFVGAGFIKCILLFPEKFQILPFVFFMFLYLVVTCYLQQIPKFAYSGMVAGLTFMIVVASQLPDQDSDVKLAAMRAAFIAMGIIWALVLSILIFPNRSAAHFQAKLVDCNNKISVLFGLIIDKAVSAEIVENGTTEAINDIKTSYQAMRVHLKEAKSELLAFRWRGFLLYEQALLQIHSAYFSLAAILSIIDRGFSASLHGSVVRPLASYLVGLVRPMMASADRVSTAFKILDVAQIDDDIGMMSISQALQALDDQYFLLRKRLLFQKSLGQLHPQLRQFYSFLFAVREFVREWKVLESSLFASFNLTLLAEEVIVHTSTGETLTPPNTPSLHASSLGVYSSGDASMGVLDLLPQIEKELASLQIVSDVI